jgi:hypothetical protein
MNWMGENILMFHPFPNPCLRKDKLLLLDGGAVV